MYKARIQFLVDRAEEFLLDGQIITEMHFDEIEELVEYVQEFADAIADTHVLSLETGGTVDLSDYVIK